MGKDRLTAVNVNWISGNPPSERFKGQVKIRYTAKEADALVTLLDQTTVSVQFDTPLRDITPGQAAVIYVKEECIGGGIIRSDS